MTVTLSFPPPRMEVRLSRASAETAVSTDAELVSVVCVTAEEDAKLAGSMP